MLDVGTHCFYCRQLDFLPFHCNDCNHDFCSTHRLKESHHCISLTTTTPQSGNNEIKYTNNNNTKSHNERFFKTLLPARASERVKETPLDTNHHKQQTNKGTTIKSSLNKSSLDKLMKFFNKHRSSDKSIFIKKPNKTNQMITLQRSAKGDTKIPQQNRIYISCYALTDDNESDNAVPLYINKIWPIGRALDYIASNLDINNMNLKINNNNDSSKKLFLYKSIKTMAKETSMGQQLIELNPNDRVNGNIDNLDILYLIRGEIKK